MKFKNIAHNVIIFKLKTNFKIYFPYYIVKHKSGNFLVGCPESSPEEVINKINEMGGISYIFISHRDDVGNACNYSKKFNAKIIVHKSESKYVQNCKVDIPFKADKSITSDVEVIHTPGHTPGSSCLFFKSDGYLFTGDQICVNKKGQPFVYLEKHKPTEGKISEKEVKYILNKLKKKNFSKIFSLFGVVLNNAKEKLIKQHKQ